MAQAFQHYTSLKRRAEVRKASVTIQGW